MRRSMPIRRWVVAATTLSLLLQISPAAAEPQAVTAGPSVPLPSTQSVGVTSDSMGSRPADGASNVLRGNQPIGSTTPGGGGVASASQLSPSAIWGVTEQSGDFTWSYPMRVPPAPGGLEPKLALSYSSSIVDGRTSATNNQPSWVGDGWDIGMGFVERIYGSCASDKEGSNTGQNVGDLCWKSDNAIASYGTGGGQLILGAGGWRAKNDDGSRIERKENGGNGDNNGEYWVITTVDGTRYFFGSRPEAQSTWTVPVYGDDKDEPCNSTTGGFDASSCTQAWRWKLDKVIDRHGNMMLLSYEKEFNKYGKNGKDAAVEYVRGGTLKQVDYGLHTSLPNNKAAGRVVFSTAERCVKEATNCDWRNTAHYPNFPDTALKDRCDGATCPEKHVPTFWSTKRLTSVTTEVLRSNGTYDGVDRWDLDQEFPDPGSNEKAALWLKSIKHTGLVGDDIPLPPVTFSGAKMPNRVKVSEGAGPLNRFRITGIVSESGGVTSISYHTDCAPETQPTEAHNHGKTCFPTTWNKPGHQPVTDYFHKYVVSQVIESDRISANPEQVTNYRYLDGAGWHYDTSEFTPNDKKTWNEYRGFAKVQITKGDPHDLAGPPTMIEQRFFRGMHGDKKSPTTGNETEPADVIDSENVKRQDSDWLSGQELETITYNGVGAAATVVEKTITVPDVHGPTATRGSLNAYIVRPGTKTTHTTLEPLTEPGQEPVKRGPRVTRVTTDYDDRGLPTELNDEGDLATADDDRCTTTTYVRNTTDWLIGFPSHVETVGVKCREPVSYPADAISEIKVSYDGQATGAAPNRGNITFDERLDIRTATGETFYPKARTGYDIHGRTTQRTDSGDQSVKTTYSPKEGGPLTSVTTTNDLNHAGTTTVEPAWGAPTVAVDLNDRKTEVAYDGLGRTKEVWQPNRARGSATAFGNGSARFSYQIRDNDTTVVTSTSLGPNGRYVSKNTLYDGLYRVRQVQQPAIGGGRLIVDTRYDAQGRVWKETKPYYNSGAVDTTLVRAQETAVPGMTITEYDGAGREKESIFKGGNKEYRTSIRYGGDRVHTTPPQGGVATTAIVDARGEPTALRQYHNGTTSGSYDETTYQYAQSGHLAKLTDPAENSWTFKHDLRGRQTETDDPDKGTTITSYDKANRPKTATDDRGITLAFDYDKLGRRTGIYRNQVGGTQLAGWTYDSAIGGKGKLATATRYVDGQEYTSTVHSYSAMGQPITSSVTIPETEGALADTYTSIKKYNEDGSPSGETFPAAGGLLQETITYEYDDVSLPQATHGAYDNGTVDYVSQTGYTKYGETERIELGEGTKRSWLSYYYDDNDRRLKRYVVDAEVPRPMVADVNYAYDKAGNILSISDQPQDKLADTQCFRYDYLQRMTEAWTPTDGCANPPSADRLGGPAPYWQSFRFDPVGNRTQEVQHTAAGDSVKTYNYPKSGASADQPHAVTSRESSGLGGSSVDSFQYDEAGNTISRSVEGRTQTLDWTPEGQLATVTEGLKKTDFVYDAQGARLMRDDPTTTTLYLGGQELRLDKATGQVTGTRYYTHGGKVVAMRTGKDRVDVLAGDHQGTQQIAINSDSLSVAQRRQKPFGGLRGPATAFPTERGFVGGSNDPSTGLIRIGARDYDPATGRFMSVDPILDTKNPQQFNAYAYANNSPVTFSDPTGLSWFQDVIKRLNDIIEEMQIAAQRSRNGAADKTLRHNKVVASAKMVIKFQGFFKIKGFNPKHLKTEVRIDKASKTNTGVNDGFADLLYDDGTNVYIWEVKSEHGYTAAQAQDEVSHYIKHYQAMYPNKVVKSGWDLGHGWNFPHTNEAGQVETVSVHPGGSNKADKGKYPGAIMYTYRQQQNANQKQPPKQPPIVPAPGADPKRQPPNDLGQLRDLCGNECMAGDFQKAAENPKESELVAVGALSLAGVAAAAAASPVVAVGGFVGGMIWATN